MQDHDAASAGAHFARGQILQRQHRTQDAIASYKHALGLDPNHAPSYLMLAMCWMQDDGTAAQAVDAARRAVALEPEDAFARSVLALAMNAAAKDGQTAAIRDALREAESAVNLDPDTDFSHAVLARLQLRLRNYPRAEAAARRALSLDTENTMAAEVLSAALLLQRKNEDNKHLIGYQLQRDADDDSAHTSAGWQALMEGAHQQANQHFAEALRLNPMNESARMGLVESYRARSVLYRLQLRFAHFMNQFTEGKQTAIMIGGFVAYQVLRNVLKDVSPFWMWVVIGVWLLFVLWSHLARGFGGFFLVLDRFARQALKPREMWEGVVVGGLVLLALAALLLSWALHVPDGGYAALACLLAAVANAAAFTNDHHIGRPIYTLAGAVAGLGALYLCADVFSGLPLPFSSLLGAAAIFTGVAISWLRPLRVMYA